jgi:hypothetical protein
MYLDHEFHEFDRKVDFTEDGKDGNTVILRVLLFLLLILPEDSFKES